MSPADRLPSSTDVLVLVANHDSAMRARICQALVEHGFSTLEVSNGIEAQQQSQRLPHQIALLVGDVNMPGMNGHQLPDLLALEQPGMAVLFTNFTNRIAVIINRDELCVTLPFSNTTFMRGVYGAMSKNKLRSKRPGISEHFGNTERGLSGFDKSAVS